MKKISYVLLISTIILVFSLVVIVWAKYDMGKELIIVEYEIDITFTNESYNNLIIPIPLIPHKITNKEGDFNISETQTIYGDGYLINGSGKCKINIFGKVEKNTFYQNKIPDFYYGFSLQNDTNEDDIATWRDEPKYFIYCNQNQGIQLAFQISIIHSDPWSGTGRDRQFEGNIPQGWSEIECEEKKDHGDRRPPSQSILRLMVIVLVISSLISLISGIIIVMRIFTRKKNA